MPSTNVNNVWGSKTHEYELEVPSGQVCLIKKVDPQQLVAMGVIDQVDVLTKLVDTKHVKRVKGKPQSTPNKVDVAALSKNPQAIVDILALSDKVVEAVILKPNVKRPIVRDEHGQPKFFNGKEIPLPYEDRVEGQIYTDMIDSMDRMFIFQRAVGGDIDLATFRRELELPVSGLANGDEVSSTTVDVSGD